MKFKVGDKVKILDGREKQSNIIWIARMDNTIGKVGEVSRVEEGWGYTVFSGNTEFWYDEEWLAPARNKAKKPSDGVRTVLVSSVYTPKRIYKGKGKTVVLWADGTKTIVKRAEGEADNDYAAFTAALAIKVFGTNSEVNRIVKRTEAAEKKKPKRATQTMTVYKVYRQVDLSQDGHGGSGYSEEEVDTFATMDEAVKFVDAHEAGAWADFVVRKKVVPLK